jgi:hypothetical protein
MLQIRVHDAQNLPLRRFPPLHDGSRQTSGTLTSYHLEMGILSGDFLSQSPGFVRAVVIDNDDFSRWVPVSNHFYPADERTNIASFIKGWNHERKHISPPVGRGTEFHENLTMPIVFLLRYS